MSAYRLHVLLTLVVLLSPWPLQSQSSDSPLVMPRDLVEFATKAGCAPIENFFERPGMVDPPFIYGWAEGDRQNSAAFWCQKPNARSYELMFKVRDSKLLAGCARAIEWQNPPAGLSIEIRPSLDLSTFRDAADTKLPKSSAQVSNAKVIVNYYDGLRDVFYCHEGRWLVSSTE